MDDVMMKIKEQIKKMQEVYLKNFGKNQEFFRLKMLPKT
jgi:hypothetical protein